VTIDELDVVGDPGQPLGPLTGGVRSLGRRVVDGYEVNRFKLPRPWATTPGQITARAMALVQGPAPVPPMIQHTSS
jgi:hypothetical protein